MTTGTLTGRLSAGPAALLDEEVLSPQFRYETAHLLPWYVRVEKVLVTEYLRMGLVTGAQAAALGDALGTVDPSAIVADPAANLSDIAFAVERHVAARLPEPVPAWHADRSRNDLQATAQLLFGRDRLRRAVEEVLECAEAARRLAARHLTDLMPGYTHLQPAQVMTPGFYLAGLSGRLLHAAQRLLAVHDGNALCPLGAGAMTGQELDWDRDAMARALGFSAAHPHPLTAVASRGWVLEATSETANLGVELSRFTTDLMAWSSGQYQFLSLPDELAGISSAMPQKKNYPVLERIRGRTAHLLSGYLDAATAQRATAFGNSVEVGKEGSSRLLDQFTTLRSVLRLLVAVLDAAEFDTAATRAAVEGEYLGGFSLANALTLHEGVPWRTAQVVAGAYIAAALAAGRGPGEPDPALLARAAAERGHAVADPAGLLERAFSPDHGILGKQRSGSAHPEAVAALLAEQEALGGDLAARLREHTRGAEQAAAAVDTALGRAAAGSR